MGTNKARLDKAEKTLGTTKMSNAYLDFIVGFLYNKHDEDIDLWSETKKSLVAQGIDIETYAKKRGLDKRPTQEELQKKKLRESRMNDYMKLRHEFFETTLTPERKLELTNEMDILEKELGL